MGKKLVTLTKERELLKKSILCNEFGIEEGTDHQSSASSTIMEDETSNKGMKRYCPSI